jgi:hypothetical protein
MKVTATIYYGASQYPVTDLPKCDWTGPLPELLNYWLREMAHRAGGHYSAMAQRATAVRVDNDMVSLTGNGWSVYAESEGWAARVGRATEAQQLAIIGKMQESRYYLEEAA